MAQSNHQTKILSEHLLTTLLQQKVQLKQQINQWLLDNQKVIVNQSTWINTSQTIGTYAAFSMMNRRLKQVEKLIQLVLNQRKLLAMTSMQRLHNQVLKKLFYQGQFCKDAVQKIADYVGPAKPSL